MHHHVRRWILLAWLLAALPLLAGCGGRSRPMTRDEIFEARMQVPTLYFTEDGRELVAPGNKFGATVDPKTKQLAWAAWKCGNPDCPGEGDNGRPYLFIWPNFLAYVTEDGEVGFRQPMSDEDMRRFEEYEDVACPACETLRDRKRETDQDRLRYHNWARQYVLPQAEKRLKELDQEWENFLQREAERRRQAGG